LIVLQRNYLLVYPYDKWVGHTVPNFQEGEEFDPSVCELREGQTSKPNYLTEADLVTLMDKNGIGTTSPGWCSILRQVLTSSYVGTDATIAQHIQTVVDREYVVERMEGAIKYLVPSTLGIGLIDGYNEIAFDKSVSKPQLRREASHSLDYPLHQANICAPDRTQDGTSLRADYDQKRYAADES